MVYLTGVPVYIPQTATAIVYLLVCQFISHRLPVQWCIYWCASLYPTDCHSNSVFTGVPVYIPQTATAIVYLLVCQFISHRLPFHWCSVYWWVTVSLSPTVCPSSFVIRPTECHFTDVAFAGGSVDCHFTGIVFTDGSVYTPTDCHFTGIVFTSGSVCTPQIAILLALYLLLDQFIPHRLPFYWCCIH